MIAKLAAALAAATLGFTPAHHARPDAVPAVIVPASPGCHFGVAGTPGIASFRLVVRENACGLTVRAVQLCIPEGGNNPRSGYWVAGNAEYKVPRPGHPYYSKSECGKVAPPLHDDIPYGLQWTATGAAPWNWAALGRNPRSNHPAAPQGKCKPGAHGVPGLASFRLYFRSDRCHLLFRVTALCWGPAGQHQWESSPYLSGAGSAILKCQEPESINYLDPAGYQFRTPREKYWLHFTETWPKPSANLK